MNIIAESRLAALKECFDRKLSRRRAAIEAGVNRGTANLYYRMFRGGQTTSERFGNMVADRDVVAGIPRQVFNRLDREAIERGISLRELMEGILSSVARDDLFGAVLDE